MTVDNDERESNQIAAETLLPIMVEAFHDGLREVASLSRWLLATLVAINGAAAISVLPLNLAPALKFAGVVAFLLGILAALGSALWALHSFKRVSIAANTMLGYWLTVAGDGPRLAALEATMKRHMDQAIGSRAAHAFVFVSIVSFLAGCVLIGWGMLASGN